MPNDWAPEPWKQLFCGPDKGHAGIEDAKGEFVEYSNANYWDLELTTLGEEDSARIIACVNACAGVPTEDLGRYHSILIKAAAGAYEGLKVIPNCPHCGKALDTYEEATDAAD